MKIKIKNKLFKIQKWKRWRKKKKDEKRDTQIMIANRNDDCIKT